MAQATFNDREWKQFVNNIQSKLSNTSINRVLAATAFSGTKLLKDATPKATGETRRAWQVRKLPNGYEIVNFSKAALFLDQGTKAHTAKTISQRTGKLKLLYIPLRPGAAVWRKGFVFGRDYVLAKKVKGIKPLNIVEGVTPDILDLMVQDFTNHLRGL